MDNEAPTVLPYVLSLHERVAILETQMRELKDIREKLDQLLELKAKGLGAMGLVSIVVGSGFLGLIATILAFVRKGHI